MARPNAPTLDRLAILDDEGRRQKLQPADSDGRIQRLKPFVRWGLIGFFVSLPWIDVGGHPAVQFDLPTRHLHLFGHVFGTGDLPFLFFLLMSIAWALVFSTALQGRVWCGWACPQTVYLEGVYRRIERLIEGNGAARMAFDLAPWTLQKMAKKLLKWSLWFVSSFLIAHIFLSYFVSIPRVTQMVMDSPLEHWPVFLVAAFATGVTYFNFAWFREQTCLIICPYGRLQSAMHDQDSVTVGYDKKRGEPRGKPGSVDDTGTPVGDCIDCRRCVQVCPTGIDIRNGLQMDCIACAACVDACDDVMRKLHKPVGLVRYDSERGFSTNAPRLRLRPRIVGYLLVGTILASVATTFAVTRGSISARVTRPPGTTYSIVDDGGVSYVQNTLLFHVQNRATADAIVHLEPSSDHGIAGLTLISPMDHLRLPAQDRADLPLMIRVPANTPIDGRVIHVLVVDTAGGGRVPVDVRLMGPRS